LRATQISAATSWSPVNLPRLYKTSLRLRKFKLSRHAQEEMIRRGISNEVVRSVLMTPEQIVCDENGNDIYQSRVDFGTERKYLVRVVTTRQEEALLVITVYRSSKIGKYWRQS
jgi:hypothetical protein